ncbi:hypothetical protein RSAG8_08657, partial [Rhizoctonia solani AG-8 WAC10335]
MIAQLAAARDSLCSALERYLSVCLAIDKSCVRYSPQDAFPELTSALSGELALVSSYEKTLLEAKLALRLARNRSTRVVPISRLTTDVLVRIFQLVTAEGNCSARDPKETNKHVFPTYPHLLTGVCSQWRQAVTSSTYLWSHIDIPCPFSCDETTLNRMKEYMARSGASLLDVHIVESDNPQMIAPMGVGALTRVLAPLSTRIRSLELKLSASPMRPLGPLATSGIIGYSMIFSTCFSNCAAVTLKRLAICAVESTTPCTFIAAAFSNPGGNSRALGAPRQSLVSLSVPEKILEDLWLPATYSRFQPQHHKHLFTEYPRAPRRFGNIGSRGKDSRSTRPFTLPNCSWPTRVECVSSPAWWAPYWSVRARGPEILCSCQCGNNWGIRHFSLPASN